MQMRAALGYLTATRLVVNTAYRFAYPFLPAISRGLGVSLEQGGLLLSTQWIAGIGTPLVVGAAGTDHRRLRTTVAGLAMFVAGAAVTAASGVYAGAIVGFALVGLAKPTFDVAARAYVADRIPYRRRARYLSVLELTWSGALLLGAPAAGWLIDRFGWQAPFWAWAALGGLALATAARALRPGGPIPEAAGARASLTRSAVMLLVVTALFTFASEVTFVVFGAWMEDTFALDLVALGGAATVIALAEFGGEGTTLLSADRLGPRRMVAAGLVVSIVAFALLGPASSSLAAGLAVLALAFFGFEVGFVASIPLATEVAPGARAAYLSLWTVVVALARAGGAAAGPHLFAWGGFAANAVLSSAADVMALVLLLAAVEEHRGSG
jgi:predicted MFS family arabinose efflux permease